MMNIYGEKAFKHLDGMWSWHIIILKKSAYFKQRSIWGEATLLL